MATTFQRSKKHNDKSTINILDVIEKQDASLAFEDWRPSPPPDPRNITEMEMDFETDGLQWFPYKNRKLSKIIGVGYWLPDGTHGYLPIRHKVGHNLPVEQVFQWMRDLKNVTITNANIGFEIQMALNEGISFEDQGCKVQDVQYWAALLDDYRKRFAQEILVQDFLPDSDEEKVTVVNGHRLDPSRMAEYLPGMVAVRCIGDVRQVNKLKKVMWDKLTEQNLHEVRQLEDECIYATCEMERNGSRIDEELLNTWIIEAEQQRLRMLWEIKRETGIDLEPKKAKSWERLFQKLDIADLAERTKGGDMCIADEELSRFDHPMVTKGRLASKLLDLESDYLLKYRNTVDKGIIRYRLNQLRSDEGGTISGRYSGSGIKLYNPNEKIGINPQQVPRVGTQRENAGFAVDDPSHDDQLYIIRKLFIPEPGQVYVSADMMQIEYRYFMHLARTPSVLDAYAKDPRMSFHKYTWNLIKPLEDISYNGQKNLNFMKIYAGGLTKLAFMLGHITSREADALRKKYHPKSPPKTEPKLQRALRILDIYDRVLPEVGPLSRLASHLYIPECTDYCWNGEMAVNKHGKIYRKRMDELHEKFRDEPNFGHRGYVTTIANRRARCPYGDRPHKALNACVQGSAGDINKVKITHLHRERKRLGYTPRITNHDEACGDLVDPEARHLMEEVLNRQAFPKMRVPALWEVGIGANWAEAK